MVKKDFFFSNYILYEIRFQNRRMKWKRNKKIPMNNSEESSTPMIIKEEPSDTADSTSSLATMSPN